MTIDTATDDELAWAVVRYLAQGPDCRPPLQIYVGWDGNASRAGVWLSGRRETMDAFLERFPRHRDERKNKRPKR